MPVPVDFSIKCKPAKFGPLPVSPKEENLCRLSHVYVQGVLPKAALFTVLDTEDSTMHGLPAQPQVLWEGAPQAQKRHRGTHGIHLNIFGVPPHS